MAKRVDGGGGEVRLWRFVSIAPSQATAKGLLLVLAYINFPFVRCPQYAAVTARSPAMMAFGSDSLVELLSAVVVVLQWIPKMPISDRKAHHAAAVLLFVLAFVIGLIALGSLILRLLPETSRVGIGITIAALIAMPVLATLKRREARRTQNAALAADAVQSATCAYIALITLAGLTLHAAFHIPLFDSFAALLAIPILIKEGRSAWKGQGCGCC
jgi:hypothetical protein